MIKVRIKPNEETLHYFWFYRARRSARVSAKPRTNSVVSLSRRPTLGLYWIPTRVGLKAKPPTGEMRFKRPVQYEAEEELS